LDQEMLRDAAHRLFDYGLSDDVTLTPASQLEDTVEVEKLRSWIAQGGSAIVYFQNALGGEIKLSKTDRSPEFSFDSTLVELTRRKDGGIDVGKYGIFEIQTADFHGSYRAAVTDLSDALRLHGDDFGKEMEKHPEWAAKGVESPNTANIFKRTFYQMMFKFQVGEHGTSAGCIFAVPRAVWESWQRHLGSPELSQQPDGTWRLADNDEEKTVPRTWIYVFDTHVSVEEVPNRLSLWRVIGTNASTLSRYALEVAPEAALEAGSAVDRLKDTITTRLLKYLPEIGQPTGSAAG
jgi:hypothetical protein